MEFFSPMTLGSICKPANSIGSLEDMHCPFFFFLLLFRCTCCALLAEQSLQLKVHLCVGLSRQAPALDDLGPIADAEFHECFAQDFGFILSPT